MAIGLYIFLQAWSMKVSQTLFLLFVLFVWMNMQHHSQSISHLFLLVIFLWLNGFIFNECKNIRMSPIKVSCHLFDTDLCHSAKSGSSRFFLYWQIPTLRHCVFLWKPSHPWRHTVCGHVVLSPIPWKGNIIYINWLWYFFMSVCPFPLICGFAH